MAKTAAAATPEGTASAAAEPGHDSLQILPHEDLQAQQLYAVPGRVNRLGLRVQCRTLPPGGWCSSGNLVARFAMRPTQTVGEVWTDTGETCTRDLYYLACPMQARPDGGGQRISFEYSVDASEYADNAGTVEGRDGFVMPLADFVIRMKGEGTLRLEPPEEVVVSANHTGGTTLLEFDNKGPSLNRGVTLMVGPFPAYLRPVVLSDDTNCRPQQNMVMCDPFDLPPQQPARLSLSLIGVPDRLPDRLPSVTEIDIDASSDLGRSQTRFLTSMVAANTRN